MGRPFAPLERWDIVLMKRKSKKASCQKIFIKTFGRFMVFYVVVMMIFTVIQSNNNKVGFREASSQLLDKIEKDLMENVQGRDMIYQEILRQYGERISQEEIDAIKEGELLASVNNYTQGFYSGAYAKVGVYDVNKKEWIAQSGNYLYSLEHISLKPEESVLDQKDREGLNAFRVIKLDDYLDFDEIAEMRQFYMNRRNEQSYYCKIKGYRNGSQVIPETIDLYEVQYEVTGDTREIISEKLIKTYKTHVTPSIDWQSYENEASVFSFEELYDINSIFKANTWRFDKNTHQYFEECKAAFEIPYLAEGLVSVHKVHNTLIREVEDVGVQWGNYYISLYAIYFPWQAAMSQLAHVYLFSFVMVILLVAILSKQLWKIYQKQEALEKGRRLLVDGMSHELKTPLSLIRAYSEALQEKISEEKRDEYLSVIIEETYKMDEMVLEMLTLSQLETESYQLRKQRVNLNELIELEIKSKQKLVEATDVQIHFKADQTYCIEVDEKRIKEVINNLLMNAILHTPKQGRIIVCLHENRLEIENEGNPIPEVQKQHIWEAFYKGDTAIMDYQKGNGLGLAIVREILKLHQFEFGVENTSSGVKFWFKVTE